MTITVPTLGTAPILVALTFVCVVWEATIYTTATTCRPANPTLAHIAIALPICILAFAFFFATEHDGTHLRGYLRRWNHWRTRRTAIRQCMRDTIATKPKYYLCEVLDHSQHAHCRAHAKWQQRNYRRLQRLYYGRAPFHK